MTTIEKLNHYLANLNLLFRNLQTYHWYITGTDFFVIHEKLEDFYNDINVQIDDVAERILAINGKPLASMTDYLKNSFLAEAEAKEIPAKKSLEAVKSDFEKMLELVKEIKVQAEKENDYGTSAQMDDYIRDYEKKLWMIGAYLK